MKTFFKKQKELIAFVVYACIIGSIGYGVVRPLLVKINMRRDQIQEEIATQEDQKKQIAALPSIKQQYLSVKDRGDTLDVLLDTNDAVTLIEQVEQLAQNTNNTVKISISQNDPDSREALIAQKEAANQKQPGDTGGSIAGTLLSKKYLEMNITLGGQYNDVANFIKKLENMQYYSDIISIDLKQDASVTNTAAQGSGIANANPFASQTGGQNNNTAPQAPPPSSGQKLIATLDAVFYLKQ